MTQTAYVNAHKIDANGDVNGFWMIVDDDTIFATGTGAAPDAQTRVDLGGSLLTPGFIDLHGHGGGGHSFDEDAEEIAAALATHRAHGTTRSVVSLVAAPVASLRASLSVIADLMQSDPLILGSHLEGPFLAAARRGAHSADFLLAPDVMLAADLIDASRGTLRQVTIAPELRGALEVIDALVDAGVRVGVGHTEADYEATRAAFDRGARLLTHAFNAMPGIHHRSPGPVVAAFDDERVTIELILDGIHVNPRVAAMVFREAPGRVALATDSMAAAGANDGDYRFGSLNVTVRAGVAVLRGTETIAGSTLTQDAALRCAIERAGVSPVDAVAALTVVPARALGLENRLGLLAPGFAADAVLFDAQWNVVDVLANGTRAPLPK